MHRRSYLVFFFILCVTNLWSQSNGDYRSLQTGNWSASTTWESYDGSVWAAAASAPAGTSGTITIQSGHTVTVDAAVTINGSAVTVNGYLKNTAGITRTSGSFTFASGSTYEHALNGGSIPTSTWSTGSLCLVTGVVATFPSGAAQSYHHFTWNCPSQSAASSNLGWGNITIGGDVTFTSTGTGLVRFSSNTSNGGSPIAITINGDLIISGGQLQATGSSTAQTYGITINGNVNVTGGTWSLSNASSGTATWNCAGNVSVTGGTLTKNGTSASRITFKKAGSQSLNLTGATIANNPLFEVANGSTLTLNSPLTVNSTLYLTNGTIVTTSTNLLTIGSAGSISGGSSSAYVNGPLSITIAATSATKTFPIGKGAAYRPVTLAVNHDAATATVYRAELFNGPVTARTIPGGIDSVSSVRYVTITKGSGANLSGTLGGTIQMSYESDDHVPDATLLRIEKDDGSGAWSNLGGSGTANTSGTITSNTFLSLNASTDFVLATATPAVVAVVPTVSTTAISDISTVTAASGGNVTNDGGAAVTGRGICWNTTGTPTTADAKTTDGTGNGSFSSALSGLTAGTTYYVRSYATNSAGTGYGSEESFTTLAALVVPSVTTTSITSIVNTTASGGGTVTAWGGTNVTARGICWNTAGTPTLENALDYSTNGSGTGSFTSALGGLSLSTTYYVRAYATNGTGTGYGPEVSFTTPAPQPTVVKVVAANGSGDYTTVQAAFDAVTSNYTGKWYIYVKNGTYYEKLVLAAGKVNVILVGENRDNTILTYDDYSGKNVNSSGTSTSYSVAIDADDFEAQNITFQNTATTAQAVALRVNGDRQEYYNCRMLGYQDTYYAWGGSRPHRIYNKDCIIQGSVDFIFGRDIALFENCTLNVNRNGGTITAANTDAGYSYGFVFKNCTITNDVTGFDGNPVSTFYLGRPWQANPRVSFLNCSEPAALNAAGWSSSSAGSATTADCYFSEYNCTGDGSSTAGRAVFSSQLSAGTAANYTISNIFAKNTSSAPYGSHWVPSKETIDYSALPVELVSLVTAVQGKSVHVSWTTATENDNLGFYIERKGTEGWTERGFIQGAGTSNVRHEYSFTDAVDHTGTFLYRLKQVDVDGHFSFSPTIETMVGTIPVDFLLSQNYPNPFNPGTEIQFAVHSPERVTLRVFDVLGQEVAMLFDGIAQAQHIHTIPFNASHLPSGTYFYSLRSASRYEVRRMLLMK